MCVCESVCGKINGRHVGMDGCNKNAKPVSHGCAQKHQNTDIYIYVDGTVYVHSMHRLDDHNGTRSGHC